MLNPAVREKRKHRWASFVAHRGTPADTLVAKLCCRWPFCPSAWWCLKLHCASTVVSASCTFPGVRAAGLPPAKASGSPPASPKVLWASPPGPQRRWWVTISSTLVWAPRLSLLPGACSASLMGRDWSCEKWCLGTDWRNYPLVNNTSHFPRAVDLSSINHLKRRFWREM